MLQILNLDSDAGQIGIMTLPKLHTWNILQ